MKKRGLLTEAWRATLSKQRDGVGIPYISSHRRHGDRLQPARASLQEQTARANRRVRTHVVGLEPVAAAIGLRRVVAQSEIVHLQGIAKERLRTELHVVRCEMWELDARLCIAIQADRDRPRGADNRVAAEHMFAITRTGRHPA